MPLSDAEYFDRFSAALRDKQPAAAAPFFAGDKARIEAGLAVYRNNIRSSLSRALADKFPTLYKLVGEDFFKFLANRYFDAHPPRSPIVRDYGDALPDFLEDFEPARGYPYLADMARFEIAWLEAYHALDAVPLKPDAVITAGDDIAALRFTFHPSLRLFSSRYPVASIWRRHQPGGEDMNINFAQGENIFIARPRETVQVRTLTMGAYMGLMALTRGESVAAAANAAAQTAPDFEPQAFFQELLQSDVITGAENFQEQPS